jgi:hypothetical protein
MMLRCVELTESVQVAQRLSFHAVGKTTVRALPTRLRAPRAANEVFDLATVLATEMRGSYSLSRLRDLVNPLWFRLTCQPNLNGALMYVEATKGGVE